jgi:hypothetical protein
MFSPDEARDWRRALFGSFFDEDLILSKALAPAPRKPWRIEPVTVASRPRSRRRVTVELRAQ